MLQLIENAYKHKERTAIIHQGKSYSYDELISASGVFAQLLLGPTSDLKEERVAFMVEPGFDYLRVQWAIWRSGGITVPLCLTHPLPALEYVIEDTGASQIVVSPKYASMLADYATSKNIRLIILGNEPEAPLVTLPKVENNRRAMILYTSGTTNKPKGVVTTHTNLEAQISTLIHAWEWNENDHTLCVLPLHHVHGIINVVSCSLWSGATCEFISEFSADLIFSIFLKRKVNVFMAVPTVYYKLIAHWETLPDSEKKPIRECLSHFRLMVCGSAALPVSILEKWKEVSGHTLLERYGMTEMGMAISNPYRGERRPGYIGQPLPGVQIRLVNEEQFDVAPGEPGEILAKGRNVFCEYWNKPEATAKEFTADGWFKTGDVAVLEDGYFRIMGRNSVDIIKSGGYKISALEIEEELRKHEKIVDCAVVGMPNEEWGELIVSAIVLKEHIHDTNEINLWLRQRITSYKIPRRYLIVEELPRNAMGKVTKNEVKKLFEFN